MPTESQRVHIEKIIAMAALLGSLRVVNNIRSMNIESDNLCALLCVPSSVVSVVKKSRGTIRRSDQTQFNTEGH